MPYKLLVVDDDAELRQELADFLEDYDVVGAKGAGMRAAHLCRRPVRNSIADFSFRDYRQLPPWVEAVIRNENPSPSE
jgi:FMN phosphatase YigB (HAD superfamily)